MGSAILPRGRLIRPSTVLPYLTSDGENGTVGVSISEASS